jgi:hypothetical protein
MRVRFHPGFARDIREFTSQYGEINERLAARFRLEVEEAIARVKESPASAGHFVDTGSRIVRDVRRRNLRSFPFFLLYGIQDDLLVFGSLIPAKSDPLLWLKRFPKTGQ